MIENNPAFRPWTGPHGAPAFAEARAEHFPPAFEAAFAERRREIEALAADPAEPTFDNTMAPLERLGRALERVASLFFHLVATVGDDALEAIEREMAPRLAREGNLLHLNPKIFARIEDLWAKRDMLDLDAEQARLLERTRSAFIRRGAALDERGKARFAEIAERLASLGATFGQNVIADERSYALALEDPADREGLPASFVDSALTSAQSRGLAAPVVTLSRSSFEPFQEFSERRTLREKTFDAFFARGALDGAHDNRPVMAQTLALRDERAKLLGFASHADFKFDDSMAKTPDAAERLIASVWAPARAKVAGEAAQMQAIIAAEGGNFQLKPWDWRHYALKRRAAAADIDEAALKPHFSLPNVIEAAFYVAERLFGVTFAPTDAVPLHHPDARAWVMRDETGAEAGLFIGDYFARGSKRSGAWMNALRDAESFEGKVNPVVVNVMNFAKAGDWKAGDWKDCQLSLDEARTLFHEFGHALHGLLSQARHPSLAGTNVPRDFVEFPSQLYEHWLETPEVLRRFALHKDTGAPLDEALIAKISAARSQNQGFATIEYCAAAFVDLALHRKRADGAPYDAMAIEESELARRAMPEAIATRHRTPHFQHVFSGDGYSAGYYSYLWSETLDSDGFEAFAATGDVFDPELAERLKRYVYSAGGTRDPAEAYRLFRGRGPESGALLRKRGLA